MKRWEWKPAEFKELNTAARSESSTSLKQSVKLAGQTASCTNPQRRARRKTGCGFGGLLHTPRVADGTSPVLFRAMGTSCHVNATDVRSNGLTVTVHPRARVRIYLARACCQHRQGLQTWCHIWPLTPPSRSTDWWEGQSDDDCSYCHCLYWQPMVIWLLCCFMRTINDVFEQTSSCF